MSELAGSIFPNETTVGSCIQANKEKELQFSVADSSSIFHTAFAWDPGSCSLFIFGFIEPSGKHKEVEL